jgi:chemotaxis protein CheC
MTESCKEPTRLEVLRQLLSSATNEASTAMCRWTRGMITLTLDEVRQLPLEDAAAELELADERLTMVVLSLEGEVGGQMILTFDDRNARQLAASLLDRALCVAPEWTALEKSALTETGNILGCAYMNVLGRLINAELVPSAPYFLQDYAASVLQQALLPQALTCDQVLVCRTVFHWHGRALGWRVFFIPTEGMQQAMEQALGPGACARLVSE